VTRPQARYRDVFAAPEFSVLRAAKVFSVAGVHTHDWRRGRSEREQFGGQDAGVLGDTQCRGDVSRSGSADLMFRLPGGAGVTAVATYTWSA
jgi:hypothetical protein